MDNSKHIAYVRSKLIVNIYVNIFISVYDG